MPPEFHDGLIRGGCLGGHGDHLNAVVVAGVGHWVTPHRCLEDGAPWAQVERQVWSGGPYPVCELVEELAVDPERAIRPE